jgi:hypothetical protein
MFDPFFGHTPDRSSADVPNAHLNTAVLASYPCLVDTGLAVSVMGIATLWAVELASCLDYDSMAVLTACFS